MITLAYIRFCLHCSLHKEAWKLECPLAYERVSRKNLFCSLDILFDPHPMSTAFITQM